MPNTNDSRKPYTFQIPPTAENAHAANFDEASMEQPLALAQTEESGDLNRAPGVERVTEVAHEAYSSDDQISLADDDELGPNALLDANAALVDAQREAQATDAERLATKVERPEVTWLNIKKSGEVIVKTRQLEILKQRENPNSADAIRKSANK